MRRKILYNILNEWRDEDMDDSPIDLDDDIDIERDSSDMDNEPNLDDDEFALSTSNTKEDILYPLKKNAHAKKLWDNFNSSQQDVVMKILEWINETRQYCFNNPENSYTFYFKNFEKYYSSQIAIGLVKDEENENEYAINGYSLFIKVCERYSDEYEWLNIAYPTPKGNKLGYYDAYDCEVSLDMNPDNDENICLAVELYNDVIVIEKNIDKGLYTYE